MHTTHTLTFLSTPATVIVSILIVLATAVLCAVAWHRSGYRPGYGALEALRLVIVILAALVFNQPEWLEEYRPTDKPTIAVMWDASDSMNTRDVVPAVFAGAQ